MSQPLLRGPVRAHCGYHKCLTMYTRGIYRRACGWVLPPRRGYRHFFHRLEDFYEGCTRYRVASVSGHALDLDRFEDIRVVRFVRDPRDLLVSGYYYHLRGAEGWCIVTDPKPEDWHEVNGVIPADLPPGESLQSWLGKVSFQRGMMAELEFRANHFDSMRAWPEADPRVRVFRYEDILGNEPAVFREVFSFLGLPPLASASGVLYAKRRAAGRKAADTEHIRDARAGQWRSVLPESVADRVRDLYGDVLDRYGYSPD